MGRVFHAHDFVRDDGFLFIAHNLYIPCACIICNNEYKLIYSYSHMQNPNFIVEIGIYQTSDDVCLFDAFVVPNRIDVKEGDEPSFKFDVFSDRLCDESLPFSFSTDKLDIVSLYLKFIFTEFNDNDDYYSGCSVFTCPSGVTPNYSNLALISQEGKHDLFHMDFIEPCGVDAFETMMNKLILFQCNVQMHERKEEDSDTHSCSSVCPCDFVEEEDELPPLIPVDASGVVLDTQIDDVVFVAC